MESYRHISIEAIIKEPLSSYKSRLLVIRPSLVMEFSVSKAGETVPGSGANLIKNPKLST